MISTENIQLRNELSIINDSGDPLIINTMLDRQTVSRLLKQQYVNLTKERL